MSQLQPFFTRGDLPPSRNLKSPTRRVALVLSLIALVFVVVSSTLWVRGIDLSDDYTGSGEGQVTFVVAQGESLSSIADGLAKAGITKSADAFLRAVNTKTDTLDAGTYQMKSHMSGDAAFATMLDPAARLDTKVLLTEGLWESASMAKISETTGIPIPALDEAAKKTEELGLPDWAPADIAGMLFPATYQISPGDTATDVLKTLISRFNEAAADTDIVSGAKALGYTPYEVLIVASIVQAEAVPDDFAKVARVIYNRLKEGNKLQLCSSVNYVLGSNFVILTKDQMATPSPYNTYLHEGLPPGPLNSPGEAAIHAALHPEDGDWQYFLTTDPGSGITKFTSSYKKFLSYKQELRDNLAKRESSDPSASASAAQ